MSSGDMLHGWLGMVLVGIESGRMVCGVCQGMGGAGMKTCQRAEN